MDSDSLPLRSSDREKKAPEFYGNPVPHSTKSRLNSTNAESIGKKKGKKAVSIMSQQEKPLSVRSIKSNSSVLKATIEVETTNKIADLKANHRQRRKDFDSLKLDEQKILIQIEDFKTRQAKDPGNAEWYAEKIQEKERYLPNLRADIASAEIRLKYESEELEEQIKVLEAEAKLKLVQVENDEEDLLDELHDMQRRKDLETFVRNSAERVQKEVPSIKPAFSQEDSSSAESEEQEEERPKRKKKSESTMEELVRLLSQKCSTNPSNSTDKVLARQVQGKDLPEFSGKSAEWPAFINAYETSTKNCQFTDAENLLRLQRCLKGEALKTVQCLLVNADSVPDALKNLKMCFGQPGMVINSLITKARDTPSVQYNKPETWVEFGVAVNNLVSTIKSLNATQQMANPSLVLELVHKLPPSSQMDWMKFVSKRKLDFPKLEDFAEWLQPNTEASFMLRAENPPEEKVQQNANRRSKHRSERAMVATENVPSVTRSGSHSQQQPKQKCCVCDSTDHKSRDCKEFKSKNVDERWEIVKTKKACFGCIGRGHNFQQCKTKRKCGVNGCQKQHNSLLHSDKPAAKETPREQAKVSQETSPPTETEHSKVAQEGGSINYFVVPAYARNSQGQRIPIYLAFDGYSSFTAISAASAKSLGLYGAKKPFTVQGFQATTTVNDSCLVDIEVESKLDNFKCTLKKVRTVPNLDLPSQSLPLEVIRRYTHLNDIDLEPFNNIVPTIMVGMDNFELHLQLEYKRGKVGEPAAVRMPLGWALIGNTTNTKKDTHHSFKMTEVEDSLHQLVKFYFTTEAVGVEPSNDHHRSREDARAQAIMDKTINRIGHGWESGLLWKEDEVHLPDSKSYALKRLYSSERKMDRDADYAKQYVEKVQAFIDKGFARELSPEEITRETPKTFYLSHFLAYNEKKSNKYRFVFDAAAKVGGRSLNDHLLQGPDKLSSLVGILLQFRQRKVAITADIQDFFPRVKVREEDAEAQRFLWRGMDRENPPRVYKMESLIFGAACSPACAQEAKYKNAKEFSEEFPEAFHAIDTKHYVDDYLDSCDTVEEAIQLQKEVTEVQNRGSFQLCNWLSNSKEVLAAIPEELHAKSLKAFDGKEDLIERVLGLFWKPETDEFTFQLKYLRAKADVMNGEKIPCKREVLSLVMSIFDALGFVSILSIKAKMILQATWRSNIGWDDQISATTFMVWSQWLKELRQIESFSIPRCYSKDFTTSDNIQLHIFCDASEEAFGTVAYFRITKDGNISTSLVMSKAHVSPLKPLSIPRLELQSGVMGTRLARFILGKIEVPINRVIYWSDSSTVLGWIRADGRRFNQFVATRIGKIQEMTEVIQWKWIPTAENVADELTRFAKPCDWSPQSRWINGPAFLLKSEKDWPREKEAFVENEEWQPELKKEKVFKSIEILPGIDPTRFASWEKLLRTTAYVQRYILLKLEKKIKNSHSHLTLGELEQAKIILLQKSQWESFPEEMLALQQKQPLNKRFKLFKYSPELQNGLIVVKGRLQNAVSLKSSVKRPIILDPKNAIVRILLDYYHRICGHHGQERISNELRQMYYILGMRTAVRSTQNRCQVCKNKRVMPVPPEMGQLPKFRLEGQVRAFVKVGLDYFGPIQIVVKRSNEKRYVALFTCLSTRAVHLEVAGSLSTDSCIMALRRFVARRGNPVSIQSDNGTNFVGANSELKKAIKELDQGKLENFCLSKRIEWNFNPPSAPHMGGSWERLVKSVKVALGDALLQKKLHEEVLHTLLVEAEHTVNSHPLTHVPHDPQDEEALTPNHFLIGASSNLQPIGEFSHHDLYGRKQWKIVQFMAEQFWKRWTKEYLPTLLRKQKWFAPAEPIKVGDIVVEVNANLPRNTWPKGRVIKLFPGQDGIVRVVDIVLANGHVYRRPVVKLCILDVQEPQLKKTSD